MMPRNILRLLLCGLMLPNFLSAEDQREIAASAFVDGYYGYDYQGQPGRKRDYVTQALYNNVPSVNLALLEVSRSDEVLRFRAAAQAGDSVNANYASEPHDWVKHLQETSVGARLSQSTWLDAGIFPSHIGPESWISRDNPTYTRSFISEFSPYYQSGLRLSTEFSPKWSGQLQLLNGWQNISDSRHPALGTQIAWKMSDQISLSQNTFFGCESFGRRIFQDFIFSYSPEARVKFIHAIDIGQQAQSGATNVWWWGSTSIISYQATEKLSPSLRFENFSDPHGVVTQVSGEGFFRARGLSAGIDYRLAQGLIGRLEAKYLSSGAPIFVSGEKSHTDELLTVVSLSYTI